jgi:hypothetical protein
MDELLPSLHYGATKATLPEQNQFALFKPAHYPRFIRLANWFRGPHIDDAALTPLGLRCLIRSRYVTATLDVRGLLCSWPLFFGPVTRLPARRREPVYTQISCFWAQVSENFLPDNLESDLSSSGFCGRAPHSYVLGEGEEVDDHPHNPHDHFVLAAVQT